jgi:hypothetical protein
MEPSAKKPKINKPLIQNNMKNIDFHGDIDGISCKLIETKTKTRCTKIQKIIIPSSFCQYNCEKKCEPSTSPGSDCHSIHTQCISSIEQKWENKKGLRVARCRKYQGN